MKTKRKLAFTLVEILIVIVVIWILAGTLLPKIMWVISRARDTERVVDLRNIASAIEMYKMDNGEYPERTEFIDTTSADWNIEFWKFAGPVSWLTGALSNYIAEIPKDPLKNNSVKGVFAACNNPWPGSCDYYEWFYPGGEYYYQKFNIWDDMAWILLAKTETVSSSNFVFWGGEAVNGLRLNCSFYPLDTCEKFKYSCSHITKGDEVKMATETNTDCMYTDESQLYYIVKI